MPKADDKQDATTNPYMRSSTHRKFSFIADADRRSLVDTFDVIADGELYRRGIDPETLEPIAANVAAS